MLLPGGIQILKASQIKQEPRLSTGSRTLDELLQGGLQNQGLVEISGESGCGKTQLCLQLTLTVQYPIDQGGFGGGAVYICTEHRFPSQRLYQLIEKFPRQFYKNSNNLKIDFSDNILVVHVSDFENLDKCLKSVQGVIHSKNIKLIIIDSIAAIFRGNYDEGEFKERVQDLRSVGSALHKLSFNNDILVVCVNQVSQSFNDGEMIPALGLAWANLVNTRIMLSRSGTSRFMEVLFSPHLASKIKREFSVTECGIH